MQVELDEQGYTLDKKWKLVLVDPSEQMTDAACEIQNDCGSYGIFKAMIANSPKPVFEKESQSRIGDIHVGGEILPEFNSDNGVYY